MLYPVEPRVRLTQIIADLNSAEKRLIADFELLIHRWTSLLICSAIPAQIRQASLPECQFCWVADNLGANQLPSGVF